MFDMINQLILNFCFTDNCNIRFKDGIELETTDRCKFLSTDSQTWILILTRVEESDLGVYECRATSKAGTLSSKARLVITGIYELCLAEMVIFSIMC